MKKWFKECIDLLLNKHEYDQAVRDCLKNVKTTQTGLGGYRVDAPITDWDEVEKELDKAKKIIDNESSLNEKDRVFRDCLLVLMRSIDVKTRKVDRLIIELEDMKDD